jgi:hypothetical protein
MPPSSASPARRKLAHRFKAANDPFKIVIVRDMWLTGFDAPCLHTMYLDKPMQGHGLMQAIAVMLEKYGIASAVPEDGQGHGPTARQARGVALECAKDPSGS